MIIENTINSRYAPPGPVLPGCTGFESIWKVEADSRYCPGYTEGFPTHSLFLTLEGCGSILLPDRAETHYLTASTLFFLPAGTSCSYRCEENHIWKYFFISLSEELLMDELEYPRLTVADNMHESTIRQFCELIIAAIVDKKKGYIRETDLLLQQLLINLKRERESYETAGEKKVTALIRWIHKNQHAVLTIEHILEFSGLNRTELFRLFKKRTGKSPGRYVIDMKLENARNLLEHTELKVRDIASELGFYDEFHFSKQYKKRYGLSPSVYRAQIRNSLNFQN